MRAMTAGWLFGGAGLAGLMSVALAREAPKLVMINESPSVPKGFYVRAAGGALERGTIVAVRQPRIARRYLTGLGVPAQVRLIKHVAAAAGDRVCARNGEVTLPGQRVAVRDRDRFGGRLPAWRGCRSLGADELFLLGDTANSFDSRYFGPVPRAEVEGVFRQVASW